MFKFLRKYNKYILAVGGTLLLITFLIPFAFEQLLPAATSKRTTWARIGEDQAKVTSRQLAEVQRELQLVQQLGPISSVLGTIDTPEYWFLLVREAELSGLVGPPALVGGDQAEQTIAFLAATTGENPQFIRETLAKVQGVSALIVLYLGSGKYSDRRLKHRARRMFHNATVQAVIIEASRPPDLAPFTDAELQEQLETYADVVPGEGDRGFGYRLPDRAKLEWLVAPVGSVRAMIEAGDQLNPVALRKHWRRNEDRFSEADAGAGVPDEVREDLLNTLTQQTLETIAKSANDQLRIERRSLDQRAGYLDLPQGWRGLDFRALAESLQSEFGIALPEYHGRGDAWLTADQLGDLPGVGTATTDKFGESLVALPELVMAARELSGSSTISIQQGVAGPPLQGTDGSVFLFRVIDTDANRPPNSIDEVRDALVADLNRLRHYEQIIEASGEIGDVAINDGLLAVALLYDSTVEPSSSVSLGLTATLPKIGEDREAVGLIIDRAMELPRDVAVRSLPEADRILVIPVEDRLSLLVAKLIAQSPLTDETYALYMQTGIILSRLLREELDESEPLEKTFSYEALAARHGFELVRPDAAEPDATTQPDAPDDAKAGY